MSRTIAPPTRSRTLLIGTVLLLATGCGTKSSSGDGGTRPSFDAGADAGSQIGTDGGTRPGSDAGVDAGSPAGGTCNTGSACNTVAQLGQPVPIVEEANEGPHGGPGGTLVPPRGQLRPHPPQFIGSDCRFVWMVAPFERHVSGSAVSGLPGGGPPHVQPARVMQATTTGDTRA